MLRTAIAALFALAWGSAIPAAAQTEPAAPAGKLAPIIVTAQKRGQAVTDVPLALTAFTGGFLQTAGITSYADLASWVPGFFASVQSPNTPSFNIRGINSDSTDPRSEMRVSVFQDGISISQAVASVTELYDIERVEVLKGPQSTLFGRSAEAGAISIITRKPGPDVAGSLTIGAGNYDLRELSGFYNTPLRVGGLLGRFAFSLVRRDGAVANLADGSRLNGRSTVAFRPSLRWFSADGGTKVDFAFNYEHDTPPGVDFKSGVIPPAGGDTSPFTAAELNRGALLGVARTVWGGALHLTHDLSPALRLHAITGWRAYDSHEEYDGDGSRLFLLEAAGTSSGRQFSQELRLNYDDGGRFSAFGGINYTRQRGQQRVDLHINERQAWPFLSGSFRQGLIAAGVPAALANVAVPVMNPLAPQAALPAGFAALALVPPLAPLARLAGVPLHAGHTDTYDNFAALDAFDLFLDGTWRVTSKLEFTLGARLSFEDQHSGYQAYPSAVPSTLGFIFHASPNFAFAPTAGRLGDADSASGWSGRFISRYAFTPDLNAYASFSRGRRPESLIITSTDRYRVREESITNLETGLKGRVWRDRLIFAASLFEYHYRHFHSQIQDPANAIRFLALDAGRATGRGGELSLRGLLTPSLQLFAAGGYTDATFDATGENGSPQRYAGSAFRLTSRCTAALGATWSHNTAGHGRWEFTPAWQYRSGYFFDDDNTRLGGSLYQPGFSLVNLSLNWRSPARSWEATARVTNLFDRHYLIDGGNLGADFGLPTFIPGNPRFCSLGLTRHF